ncbi:adenylylsulfate reductase, thioredoxin dependent [Hyphomicrobium denitrificans ATCC 51888]|uniref:Adenosine 5'-phosphosulfate reductase n=1 Tax=Hyphomicrobium denitrificans (strain ATCC 51888 / DSM 1869 / NCIMB 11706 / TK 0415) TaxID=582899 RepID=D8JV46_HYPDA|nr:phosphoadenylyl-sulfate reductase [Hyphomicrobium denitrificans]ADJ22862.1 adenylylsulfate reductase, thioredoxin dependent [Hyphomicrobium denitrificans ATCC 51888]
MTLFEATASPASGGASDPHAATQQATAADLDRVLGDLPTLGERIKAIRAAIDGTIAFSTSLGIEDQAITHAIAETGAEIDIFTLDTGRHFPETLDTLFDTEGKYGLRIRVMYPDAAEVEDLVANDGIYGFRYSVDARKACCEVRKVRPLNRALNGAAAWVTGLRREQSQGRAHVHFATYDPAQKLIKLNPIADWSLATLEDYVATNKIPVNALHAKGFPSIGCQPCTRAIKPGEDIRAGRWWWESEDKKECGLHTQREDPGFEEKDHAA